MLPAMTQPPDTEELLRRAAAGNGSAADQLLVRHRDRLCHMVAIRLDPRVAQRADPSDVVQEALAEAHRRLPQYLVQRPIPFYPWLRQLAWDKLLELHRRHVQAGRRSVAQECVWEGAVAEPSAVALADQLLQSGTCPSRALMREEMRAQVRRALDQLSPAYREVLVLRFLEQLSTEEAAAVLEISPSAFKARQVRALHKLRLLLNRDSSSS